MRLSELPWEEIRRKYESGKGTYRELAEDYGTSACSVGRRARAEGWRRPRRLAGVSESEQFLLAVVESLKHTVEETVRQSGEGMHPKELKEMTGVLRELVQLRQTITPSAEERGDGTVRVVLEAETEEWAV